MMSTILRDDSLIESIVTTTWLTTAPPLPATSDAPMASWLACLALSAFCLTVEVISSMLLAVSSRLLACSSVRCDRSLLPAAISFDAVLIVSVASLISPTSCLRLVTVPLTASLVCPKRLRILC